MEKNITRQDACPVACPTDFNTYIVAILGFLDNLPGTGADVDLCNIVNTESTELLADLLDCLACFIEDEFIPDSIDDETEFGFLAQIDRLVCIIELLADRVRAITCPDAEECLEVLYEVLCALVEAIAILIGIIIKLIVLQSFLADNDNFFECLVCSLIGEITCLEESVKELSCLIIALISCDIEECTPCFVATKAGKRPRPVVDKKICDKKHDCDCKKH